jgi:ribosome biogenesis GTPase
MIEGRVFKSTGSWYEVHTTEGEIVQCRLRGKFKNKNLKVNNPIAVGDYVILEKELLGDNTAVITKILPRTNYIIRKSTKKTGFAHILSSNIDQAMLMATLAFPRTSLGFIDRFLVSAESFRIPALVIFNKSDIFEEDGIEYAAELQTLYEALGYKTAFISVLENKGMDKVNEMLEGKTTLIAGHSGVGKSSFLNKVLPDLALRVGEVSTFAEKGKHTTTFAEMFEVKKDTFLIDTPGIKELGLFNMESHEISDYFPEMRVLIGACKFHNCSHTIEPDCAILRSLEQGEIAPSRYDSYLSMLENDDNRR